MVCYRDVGWPVNCIRNASLFRPTCLPVVATGARVERVRDAHPYRRTCARKSTCSRRHVCPIQLSGSRIPERTPRDVRFKTRRQIGVLRCLGAGQLTVRELDYRRSTMCSSIFCRRAVWPPVGPPTTPDFADCQ